MSDFQLIFFSLFIFACGFTTGAIIVNNSYSKILRKYRQELDEKFKENMESYEHAIERRKIIIECLQEIDKNLVEFRWDMRYVIKQSMEHELGEKK